mmetsp:Transcript_5424/g.13579  ORF Transcript_5424/g.13579 Transcript_5424/m.13579 type:complete len:222 (+) Transcript_5424:220-885(+)
MEGCLCSIDRAEHVAFPQEQVFQYTSDEPSKITSPYHFVRNVLVEWTQYPARMDTGTNDLISRIFHGGTQRVKMIRELRLAVRNLFIVFSILPVEVIKINISVSIGCHCHVCRCATRQRNKPRRFAHFLCRLEKHRYQQMHEKKMPQVVTPELHLKSVLCLLKWTCHDTGIIYEGIQAIVLFFKSRHKILNALKTREVKWDQESPFYICSSSFATLSIATS